MSHSWKPLKQNEVNTAKQNCGKKIVGNSLDLNCDFNLLRKNK